MYEVYKEDNIQKKIFICLKIHFQSLANIWNTAFILLSNVEYAVSFPRVFLISIVLLLSIFLIFSWKNENVTVWKKTDGLKFALFCGVCIGSIS